MKKKIKKAFKNRIFIFTLGVLLSGTVSVFAVTYFPSNDVIYDNSSSGLESTNVQGAIDELYGVCTAEPPADIIEDNGLEKDPYECRYFFTGVNPNNYVTFNGEKAEWRIISVGCDGTIKIIKNESIGDYPWALNGNNNWNNASLNTYLNETYLNSLSSEAQSQIVASDFSIGAVTNGNDYLTGQVNDENSVIWNGKIALPTLSEYLRTNSNSNCKTFSTNNNNYSTCKNTTWMFNGDYWWTLSPSSGQSFLTFIVYLNGLITNDGVFAHVSGSSGGVRPTLYISSKVKITGGDGSQSNPYILG